MRIHKLPPDLVAKIAAGEVIERPAYVVKELIENAIDASATEITIRIENAGSKLIEVIDNGSGMSREDLVLAPVPHTTSKISSENDLLKISTLGFRGEALSSIASVARLSVSSRVKGSKDGYLLTPAVKLKQIGMKEGTRVTVENLFANTPARQKFLKSELTEYRNIQDVVTSFGLSNNISLEVIQNGKQSLFVDRGISDEDKIHMVLGETVATNLISIKCSESYISVHGFTSRPQVNFSTTNKIYLFVNGRRIYDSLINSAIRDAYSNLLEPRQFPVSILHIKVPHELVDVNVHPQKESVRFIDNQHIYMSINNAIRSALEHNNLTYTKGVMKLTKTNIAKKLRRSIYNTPEFTIKDIKANSSVIQIHKKFLIMETKKGVLFLDQHAVHEAILFRKLNELYLSQKHKSALLKKSQLMTLSLSDSLLFDEYYKYFQSLGFEVDKFDDKNTYKITMAPESLLQMNLSEIISDVIEDIREERPNKKIDSQVNRMLAYLACRSAIKTGDKLTKKEIQKLTSKLQDQDYLYTCPHGRPVMIEFSLGYLDTIFKR